jgi:hypothetical protein
MLQDIAGTSALRNDCCCCLCWPQTVLLAPTVRAAAAHPAPQGTGATTFFANAALFCCRQTALLEPMIRWRLLTLPLWPYVPPVTEQSLLTLLLLLPPPTDCPAGTYDQSGGCTPCPTGHWCPGGTSSQPAGAVSNACGPNRTSKPGAVSDCLVSAAVTRTAARLQHISSAPSALLLPSRGPQAQHTVSASLATAPLVPTNAASAKQVIGLQSRLSPCVLYTDAYQPRCPAAAHACPIWVKPVPIATVLITQHCWCCLPAINLLLV